MKQRESIFKEKVIKFLKGLPNCWFYKTQEVSLIGIPDIIGCINGKLFALELKKDIRSKPSKMQLYILDKVKGASGYAAVTYPEVWNKVKGELLVLSRSESS